MAALESGARDTIAMGVWIRRYGFYILPCMGLDGVVGI